MRDLQEQYLVAIADGTKSEIIYTLVPSNREFACLLDTLNSETHIVMAVTPLANIIDFKELMARFIKVNKPNGLNFGDNEE